MNKSYVVVICQQGCPESYQFDNSDSMKRFVEDFVYENGTDYYLYVIEGKSSSLFKKGDELTCVFEDYEISMDLGTGERILIDNNYLGQLNKGHGDNEF